MILGKEGEQPFEIKQEGVSRKHAEITIHGDVWELIDLGSANGTFVREDNGEFRPLGFHGKCIITPMTYISLGPDNSKGCGFYARQILNPKNNFEIYELLNQKEDELERKLEVLDLKIKKIRILGPTIVILLVFVITSAPAIKNLLGRVGLDTTEIRWALSYLSGLVTTIYDGAARKNRLKKEHSHWCQCPNPCCDHKLKPEEIRNMKCNKCRQ